MAKVHGKNTVILLTVASPAPSGTHTISLACNTSGFNFARDNHDDTCYGEDGHTYTGGLTNHTFTCGGIYDSSTSDGPHAILRQLMSATGNQKVTIDYRIEGTGDGLPEETFEAVLTAYAPSSPAADMITWSADFQVSGSVTMDTQSA